jgi:hypothetical protein
MSSSVHVSHVLKDCNCRRWAMAMWFPVADIPGVQPLLH